jgi:hypothetical protein
MPHTMREKKEFNTTKKPEDNLIYELTIPVK